MDECADCGYYNGEHADDCPVSTGMSRERYALIRRCANDPAWAADEILRLRNSPRSEEAPAATSCQPQGATPQHLVDPTAVGD